MKLDNYLRAKKAIEKKRAALDPIPSEYVFRDNVRNAIISDNEKTRQELHETIKNLELERETKRNKNNFILHEIKILQNNLRIALYNDVAPVIIETINAYAGKKHGEKTAEKIRQELKAKINCSVFLHSTYIYVNLLDNSGFASGVSIEVHTISYDTKIIDGDNVLQELKPDQYCHYYGETITDTKKRVKAILAAYENAKKERENYYKAVSQYNALVSKLDIKQLNYPGNVEYIFLNCYENNF